VTRTGTPDWRTFSSSSTITGLIQRSATTPRVSRRRSRRPLLAADHFGDELAEESRGMGRTVRQGAFSRGEFLINPAREDTRDALAMQSVLFAMMS